MFIWILLSVLSTSFISGVIGMAGGMILMGVLSLFLPVMSAMVLHGVIQMHSNGFRAFLHKKHIKWEVLPGYVLGAFLGFLLFGLIGFTPNKIYIFLTLGLFGLVSIFSMNKMKLDIMKGYNSFICGFVVIITQIFAGASGPVLDVFYLKSSLTRYEVIATKSITQVLGHLFKVYFYGRLLLGAELEFSMALIPLSIATVFLGTGLGKLVLKKISEEQFLKYSRVVVGLIACVYLSRGFWLLKSERDKFPLKLNSQAEVEYFSAEHFDRQLKTGHVKPLILDKNLRLQTDKVEEQMTEERASYE